jgi:hypothetical protein
MIDRRQQWIRNRGIGTIELAVRTGTAYGYTLFTR